MDALDAEVSVATGSCADAFVHDVEGHTLAVRAPWLAHVMGAAFAALAAARRAGTEAGPEALDRASRAVALLCGECETAWNARRTLARALAPARELALCALALSRQPKCGATWQYRAWVLARHPDVVLTKPEDFAREHALVDRAVVRYPRNYAAWTHRAWLLARMHRALAPADAARVARTERAQSTEHCRRHVSDASAFHYRRVLLAHTVPDPCTPREAAIEACWALALARLYPGHETLWTHCAFVLVVFQRACRGSGDNNSNNKEKERAEDEEERAEEFLDTLDETLPLEDAVTALVDKQHPTPAILARVVALIAEDTTSAAYAAQAHFARHTHDVLQEEDEKEQKEQEQQE